MISTVSYSGKHADLYDIFYKDKPYNKEASFINALLKKYSYSKSKFLLEVACGTGSHALFLEKLGYKVTASDSSPDMISVAMRKKVKHESNIQFDILDMRNLPKFSNNFDAAICLFDSIGYLITNNAINMLMKGIYRNLRKDGLFIFEFWHDQAMLKYFDPVRIRIYNTENSEIIRISETEIDKNKNIAKVQYTIVIMKNNGRYEKITETQNNRFFSEIEMKKIILKNGFKPLKFYAGYDDKTKINNHIWHILAVTKKI